MSANSICTCLYTCCCIRSSSNKFLSLLQLKEAENQTTMEEGTPKRQRKCELCSATFQTTKTLKSHYASKHGLAKDDDIVKSTPKSPKKPCKRCGKQVANIWAHKHSCKARRKDGDATTSNEPSPAKAPKVSTASSSLTQGPLTTTTTQATDNNQERQEKLSNVQFLARYRAWMESANGNYAVEKTVRDYSRQVGRFIKAQLEVKPGFQARHWMGFGSRNFMPLANVGEWIPRETKSAHAGQKINAYKHLLRMIRSSLMKTGGMSPEFAYRIAHLDEMNREATTLGRNFKSGRYARASGEERRAPTTVNTRGWRNLMKAYRKSAARAEALELFSGVYR